MKLVNVYEAKSRLSAIIDEALRGEEIVIGRHGKPVVRLVPVHAPKPSDGFGSVRGQVWIAPDFDETPADFEDYT
jgi:prevent-host-death family protein